MLEKYVIWLDDIRDPEFFFRGDPTNEQSNREVYGEYLGVADMEFVWVKNGDDFKNIINERGIPSAICFDHDLGLNSCSGYDCLKWLIDKYLYEDVDMSAFPKCISQSDNSVGRENIMCLYNNFIDHMKMR